MTAANPRFPAAFIGHGSPMNAIEQNRYTESWRAFGAALPRPRAVLVISAHWYIQATAVTAMARPKTIHDFYGFPPELFAFDYPAPGDPSLAEEVAEVVKPVWVGSDHDSWGIDHGTWSVLAHVLPDAAVPVVQLSINGLKPLEYHLELGARLAPLRKRGVLIVGSGNVVHNLRRLDWNQPDGGFDWARRFDDAVRAEMTGSPGEVMRVAGHRDFASAVPTPDHFIPLLYIAAMGGAGGHPSSVLVDGYTYGALSMTSYVVDGPVLDGPRPQAGAPPQAGAGGGATAGDFPDPRLVPPDDTNT
ncbi:MAG TPA: 4,5-DOPA dioxygenase extradiol [Acidimicrobiales bacterium]|nr:4,5-DOPA dioxygenase extradiol [Acidimicrobiales bacterium]